MTEPGYCDHGKSLRDRCFWCKREAAKRPGRPPKELKVEPVPEHRNPPAPPERNWATRGGKGGAATAAKKARLRGKSWADL
jgi:hypothetical protein